MTPTAPLRLHQFPPALGLPNASSFCLKLEAYLRLAGLPYESVYASDMRGAPKGKMPWIEDGATRLGDSSLIIDYLKQRYGDPLDARLDARQRALGVAVQRMVEEHLYFALLWWRWVDDAGWAVTRAAFFAGLPAPLRALVAPLVRRGVAKQLHAQGMGRFDHEERCRLAQRDLDALAALLGDQPYLLGEIPSSYDVAIYALLANVLLVELDTPLKTMARAHLNLVGHTERMHRRCFG